jgi:WD40 repeat protein
MTLRSLGSAVLAGLALLVTSEPGRPADAEGKMQNPAPRVDAEGDPLPRGVVARLGTLRLRHGGLGGVAFSPDGKRVATWGSGGLQIADAVTGRTLHEDRQLSILAARFGADGKPASVPETRGATAAAYSADGKTAAHGMYDGSVRIHDTATGKLLHELVGPKDGVRGVALAPDGKTLARAGEKSVGLWDVATGKETRLLDAARDGSPFCCAFSPDGKTLVTGEYFGKPSIRAWDVATAQQRFAVEDLFGYFPRSVAFAADGKSFAHTGEGGVVFLRNAADGKELRRFKTERNTYAAALSPDGKTLAAAVSQYPAGSETRVFDVESGRERFAYPRHELQVEAVFFSADGKLAVTSGIDRTVRIWDAATGKHLFAIGAKKIEAIQQTGLPCALSADGKTVLVAQDAVIGVWDAATGKELRRLNSPGGRVVSLSVAPRGKAFAALCLAPNRDPTVDRFIPEYSIHVLDAETGKVSLTLPGLDSAVNQVKVSPDGTLIALGAPDTLHRDGVTLYTPAGRKLAAFARPMGGFAISPDDKVVAVSTDKVRFWDTAGELAKTLDSPRDLRGLVYSPNGQYLAGADSTRWCVFEASSGKVVWEQKAPYGGPVAFSPDGTRLLTGTYDGTALIWEMPDEVSRR